MFYFTLPVCHPQNPDDVMKQEERDAILSLLKVHSVEEVICLLEESRQEFDKEVKWLEDSFAIGNEE